jgi:hypothetical protein
MKNYPILRLILLAAITGISLAIHSQMSLRCDIHNACKSNARSAISRVL